jgi:hypothetical protein
MKNQITEIERNLSEGYTLVSSTEHKSSQYFYIARPDGLELKARISDHETMTGRSASHVNILSDRFLHIDFDFEMQYDADDYEIELTKEEAAKQISEYYGVEVDENSIEECSDSDFQLDNMELDWKVGEAILGKHIAECIMNVTNVCYTY